MGIFKNLFGKTSSAKASAPVSRETAEQSIRDNTEKLWLYLGETVEYFNSIACVCAFPRYRQLVGIDCSDYGKSFYCSETEGLISKSASLFNVRKLDTGPELYNEEWTCKKCGSIYRNGWSDFSIHVNRTFLKLEELKASETGAAPLQPIPLFVGIFGHSLPDKTQMEPVSFEVFSSYIRELRKPEN